MSIIYNKYLRGAGNGRLMHWCEGCKMRHMIWTDKNHPAPTGAAWTWDGNTIAPDIHPSININLGMGRHCHYFVRNGMIEYCGDSFHELRNQVVALPDFPVDEDDEPEDYMIKD